MQVLISQPNTRRLSVAYFLSKSGEFAFEVAFAVTVIALTTADLLLIGLVYFFRYLPCIVFAPIGGWLADNVEKKLTLTVIELSKTIVIFTLFIICQYSEATITIVIMVSMLMTALDCLYSPTFRAFLPDVVENRDLASANSGIQVIEDVSSITGPLLFSLISVLLTPSYVFLFFSASLLASAACTWTLISSSKRAGIPFNISAIIKDTACSAVYLRKHNQPLFKVIFCTTLCAMFATSVIRFILPAAALDNFESEAVVGYIFSLLALGTVMGGMLYVRLSPTTTAQSVIRYWLLYGILFLLTAVALELNTYLFACLLMAVGFVGAFVDIAIITNIQSLSKPEERGKNFSLYYFTAVIGDATSGLMSSFMFLIIGPATFIGMTFMLCITPLAWNIKKNDT